MNFIKSIIIGNLIFLFLSSLKADNELINNITIYKDSVWYKTIYNYNSDNQIINSTTLKSIDKNKWGKYTYSTISYQNGAISKICDYTWNDTIWILNKEQNYEYSANLLTKHNITIGGGEEKEIISYKYLDSIHIVTHNFFKKDYLKNTNISIKKYFNNKIIYIKNASISSLNDTIYSQYSTIWYTSDTITTTTYEKNNSIYLPTTKNIQYIDINNNILSEIQYKYQDNSWTKTARQIYTYLPNGKINDITYQYWNNNFWLSDYKRHYEYNSDGLIYSNNILSLIYKEWELLYSIKYLYNNSNQIESANIEQTFWSETEQLYNDYIYLNNTNSPIYCISANKAEFDYHKVSTDIPMNITPINLYPNPSKSGIVFINSHIPILKITVFNINGIILYENNHTDHINLSHLNNGVYIIHITTENEIYTFKQIITNN